MTPLDKSVRVAVRAGRGAVGLRRRRVGHWPGDRGQFSARNVTPSSEAHADPEIALM